MSCNFDFVEAHDEKDKSENIAQNLLKFMPPSGEGTFMAIFMRNSDEPDSGQNPPECQKSKNANHPQRSHSDGHNNYFQNLERSWVQHMCERVNFFFLLHQLGTKERLIEMVIFGDDIKIEFFRRGHLNCRCDGHAENINRSRGMFLKYLKCKVAYLKRVCVIKHENQ